MAGSSRQKLSALILAIFLGLSTAWWMPAGASPIDGDYLPGGSPPPGDTKGDPDVPTGTTRSAVGAQRVSPRPEVGHTVGDGAAPQVSWMWRLRIVLQGLRAYWFRF